MPQASVRGNQVGREVEGTREMMDNVPIIHPQVTQAWRICWL